MLYLGTAQEKFTAVRTEKRRNPAAGRTYPWLVRGSVLAIVYYCYIVDEDLGRPARCNPPSSGPACIFTSHQGLRGKFAKRRGFLLAQSRINA